MKIGNWKIVLAPKGWNWSYYRTVGPAGDDPSTGEPLWITTMVALGPVRIVRVSR